jgi:cysteine desulfuration protein SufE
MKSGGRVSTMYNVGCEGELCSWRRLSTLARFNAVKARVILYMSDEFDGVGAAQLAQHTQWQAQYKQIILWGKQLTRKPHIRCDDFRIAGCEVPVWLRLRVDAAVCYVDIDVDSLVIGGLAMLVAADVHGRALDDINPERLRDALVVFGLDKHLTPSRNNGLIAIIDRLALLLKDAMPSGDVQSPVSPQ